MGLWGAGCGAGMQWGCPGQRGGGAEMGLERLWAPPPALQTCQWWDEAAKALQRDVGGLGRQLEAVRLREE